MRLDITFFDPSGGTVDILFVFFQCLSAIFPCLPLYSFISCLTLQKALNHQILIHNTPSIIGIVNKYLPCVNGATSSSIIILSSSVSTSKRQPPWSMQACCICKKYTIVGISVRLVQLLFKENAYNHHCLRSIMIIKMCNYKIKAFFPFSHCWRACVQLSSSPWTR